MTYLSLTINYAAILFTPANTECIPPNYFVYFIFPNHSNLNILDTFEMPNAFSRYCFRPNRLEEGLAHYTVKSNYNGCDVLFGESKCAKLLDWTDGENAENVQVSYSEAESIFIAEWDHKYSPFS